jgi:molybdopterin-guanine dinucleotide biosynthesis protein A
MQKYAAVVLAGGRGRRLGGPQKPAVAVAGRPMLGRVLAAVAGAAVRVVVGPSELGRLVPNGVSLMLEDPPGGGPVAALAAGLTAIPADVDRLVLLAADLPLLSPPAVDRLLAAVDGFDGAVYVDGDGRRQWLCGAWRVGALRDRLAGLAGSAAGRPPGDLAGRSLRDLFGPLRVADVSGPAGEPPPWYDCDTPAEVAEAERLQGGSA